MSKTGSAAKVKLNSFDDLFGTEQPQTGTEQVQEIALSELHEFKGHPFKVLDDEKMQETMESIREHGVLMPGIARPMKDGGYEIIAGHRRRHACEIVGLATMPMFIRDYTDDEATIIMVDSNIQREDILPSEKAKAYRMKYDAMKHQGSKEGGLTLGELGEAAGESAKTVQRYIWISRLSDSLLNMVDAKKIGIMQAVDLSFLSEDAQQWVLVAIQETNVVITTQQSAIYIQSMWDAPTGQPYYDLRDIVAEKEIFVLTTNIDMQFERIFQKERICDYQGNIGYLQCSQPCHDQIYSNVEMIRRMNENIRGLRVTSELLPRCNECGRIMVPWVRDDTFLEGKDWREGVRRYENFLKKYLMNGTDKNVVLLELGVGEMTPSIIKLPFWEMTYKNEKVFYACLNQKKSSAPEHIKDKGIYIAGDLAETLRDLKENIVEKEM